MSDSPSAFLLASERKTNELLRTEVEGGGEGGGGGRELADKNEAKENKCGILRRAERRRVGATQARRRQTKFRVQAACWLAFWHGGNDETHQEANGRSNRGPRPVKLLYRLFLKPTNSTEPNASATASAPAPSKSPAAQADNKALGLNFNHPVTGRGQRRKMAGAEK